MQVTLLDVPPHHVEVRGNIVYYYFADGEPAYAQPIHAALRTSAMVQDAVREWRENEGARVLRLGRDGG